MLKRIIAWILLAGFVFLIFNIILFGFYIQLSIVIYLIILFAFLFTNRKAGRNPAGIDPDKDKDENKGGE